MDGGAKDSSAQEQGGSSHSAVVEQKGGHGAYFPQFRRLMSYMH